METIQMKQIYKITNLKNSKSYIGISICADQNHMNRFDLHMTGKGGVWIKRDLDDGLATRDDFVIELLEEGTEPVEYYRSQEIYYIEYFNTLHPNGYNGNKGYYIVMTPELLEKAQQKRKQNFEAGLHKPYGKKGYANYRYSDGQVKYLPIDHLDVTNGIVKHINYNPLAKGRAIKQSKRDERVKNNGYTDAQLEFFDRIRELSKTFVNNDNWQKGRDKFRERMAQKDLTEAELLAIQARPEKTKQQWAAIDPDEKANRVSNGLTQMNTTITCPHCGQTTNKGNYTRWHGNNCKTLKPKL